MGDDSNTPTNLTRYVIEEEAENLIQKIETDIRASQ
jgi:hypothetical protein